MKSIGGVFGSCGWVRGGDGVWVGRVLGRKVVGVLFFFLRDSSRVGYGFGRWESLSV